MSEYIYDTSRVETQPEQGFTGEEIIRCGDCRYCNKREFLPDECVRDGYLFDVEPDGFCKWAERRDE